MDFSFTEEQNEFRKEKCICKVRRFEYMHIEDLKIVLENVNKELDGALKGIKDEWDGTRGGCPFTVMSGIIEARKQLDMAIIRLY